MMGQILKETREAAGLTQVALALAAGVDRSYVSQLERDKKSPTIQMLFRLCPPMKVKPSQLIARFERACPRESG